MHKFEKRLRLRSTLSKIKNFCTICLITVFFQIKKNKIREKMTLIIIIIIALKIKIRMLLTNLMMKYSIK